jgi:DNA mismatch endonuclease (patch repair protein)
MAQVDPTGVTLTSGSSRTVNLGRGLVVPYPEPVNEAATKIGKANRRTNTKPEVLIRSAVHQRGLRFRKDFLLRVGAVRVRPDMVFTRGKVAVFVDGCFWHSCPDHSTMPKRNVEYWLPKLQANIDRDRRADAALAAEGWQVVRVWEHDEVDSAAERIALAVRNRRPDRLL